MAIFTYKAIRGSRREGGDLEAPNRSAAQSRLRSRGYVILEISEKAVCSRDGKTDTGKLKIEAIIMKILIFKSQIEITLRQMASVLKAGVPILAALESVKENSPYFLKLAYSRVAEKVRQGYTLKRGFSEDAPFLGDVTIGLIAAGEANGTLDEMLAYSAELMERSRKVKGQIVQAFTYPAIVVLGAIGVGYYMVVHVFPKIMTFITKQGKNVTLPLPTRILIQVNDFLTAYGIYVLLTPVVLVIVFVLMRRTKNLGEKIDAGLLRVPLLGKAFRYYANAMWCRTFGAMLASGIDILSALDLVIGTMANKYYALQFHEMKEIIRQGGSLTRGLKQTQLCRLCPMSLTMVSVSETSGGLDESLLHVAEYSEEQLTRRVSTLSKMVEPAIFIVVGGMVGFIYFAFFMAMLAATHSASGAR